MVCEVYLNKKQTYLKKKWTGNNIAYSLLCSVTGRGALADLVLSKD